MQDATSQDIRELFSQFGTIKPQNGAITVKHNGNNNSFAYVDFVDVASAQACVEAKDVQLNGVTVSILSPHWDQVAKGMVLTPLCMHSCTCVNSYKATPSPLCVCCCLCIILGLLTATLSCHTCSKIGQGQLHAETGVTPAVDLHHVAAAADSGTCNPHFVAGAAAGHYS